MPLSQTQHGPWALITGASAGLGAEYARQIAAKGLNTILVARRRDRLKQMATEIRDVHGVKTRVVEADLTENAGCQRVIGQTGDLEVGLLVNNAGYGMSGYYHNLDPDKQTKMVVLNCVVPVLLTNHYLPLMIERKRGGLIFLASTAGYQACGSFGTYGATKAFNLMLGEALWKEGKANSIDSLAVSPGFTRTEFTEVANIADAGIFRVATPDSVVRASLRNLGRRPSFVHGTLNKFLNLTGKISPRRVAIAITHAMLKGRSQNA